MPNEKMENLLNLALAATQEEREKSLELDIGYDSAEQTWEVIVKFVGTTAVSYTHLTLPTICSV